MLIIKNFILLSFFTISVINLLAQNVGIGTTSPSFPLTVRKDGIGISQENSAGKKQVGFFSNSSVAYVQTHDSSDLNFATNNGSADMVLKAGTGNVGIGITNPSAKLHVNGSVKLTDGTQGVNKVLTSDAAGNATWKNTAYGNTERFMYVYKVSNSAAPLVTQIYNYGTTSATGSPVANHYLGFTVSKAGLYHFDVNFTSTIFSDFSSSVAQLSFLTNSAAIDIVEAVVPYIFSTVSYAVYDKSFDLYLPAAGNVKFYLQPPTVSGAPYTHTYRIGGYLIAE